MDACKILGNKWHTYCTTSCMGRAARVPGAAAIIIMMMMMIITTTSNKQ